MSKEKQSLTQKLAAIETFAHLMRRRIEEEEHAGRDEWDRWTVPQLVPRLNENLAEVTTALSGGLPAEDVARCCANLANYAAILADLVERRDPSEWRCLVAPPPPPPS